MTEPTTPASSEESRTGPLPIQIVTTGNLAVAYCMQAYEKTFKAERAKKNGPIGAQLVAARQYRLAMPAPSGRDGIRDFVACVAHGVLIGAINAQESKALLYAAQVAQSALREPPRPDPKRY